MMLFNDTLSVDMGTGSLCRGQSGRGVGLTTYSLLAPEQSMGIDIPLPAPMPASHVTGQLYLSMESNVWNDFKEITENTMVPR
jgi:hypothetical protein